MLSGEISVTIEGSATIRGSGDEGAVDSGIEAQRAADEACLVLRRVDLRAITIFEAWRRDLIRNLAEWQLIMSWRMIDRENQRSNEVKER